MSLVPRTGNARAWLVPGAGLLALIGLLCALGAWQLERAEEKRRLFRAFAAADAAGAVAFAIGGDALAEHRYRRLELTGEFVPSRQILLDAMTYEGRAGYHVLTPFRARGSSSWILVNRGWLSATHRGRLPELEVDGGERTLRGRIDALPRPGLRLASTQGSGSATWPRVLLFPTMDELENVLGVPLAGYQLLLDATDPDGFVREWQPRTLPPERHIGYAVQWFGLAAVLVAGAAVIVIREVRA